HVGMKQLSRRGLLSSGRVLGEGSAFLVLEREEDARARGARVLGILESVALAASSAIDLSEVAPEPIEDAVSRCRGTRSLGAVISSAAGDPRGDAALARALGATAPVVSFRAALGDTLAAGPAIDLVLALEALERRTLPATPPLNGDPILVVAAGLSATVGAAVLGAAS
ncbi:MAG TPA: hypothetical protein VFF73_08510, partial [Planctomycetota bacterium]|nr:hypothetical protein [Planctomycetota bacterium]